MKCWTALEDDRKLDEMLKESNLKKTRQEAEVYDGRGARAESIVEEASGRLGRIHADCDVSGSVRALGKLPSEANKRCARANEGAAECAKFFRRQNVSKK